MNTVNFVQIVDCCMIFELHWNIAAPEIGSDLSGKYRHAGYLFGKQLWTRKDDTAYMFWDNSITGWKVCYVHNSKINTKQPKNICGIRILIVHCSNQ